MPRALITGITGQDGSYLAELLLSKGYEVHGMVREGADPTRSLVGGSADRIRFHVASFSDTDSLRRVVSEAGPDELYHLAAQTHVAPSVADPAATLDTNTLGTARLLEICFESRTPPRFFHASSSQIFGQPRVEPQDEETPVRPVNPYGVSKAASTSLVQIARESRGLFAVNGILYNHESPRRGSGFVTAKICGAAVAIRQGRQAFLSLGNTTSQRDWGDARDFVDGFWRALQAPVPGDYVFATGKLHSVQDIVEVAFTAVGVDWRGLLRTDPSLLRPADPTRVVGDPGKARRILGWEPKTNFETLVRWMVASEDERSRVSMLTP
jgi:GDPmannose 4,6-dehydratase